MISERLVKRPFSPVCWLFVAVSSDLGQHPHSISCLTNWLDGFEKGKSGALNCSADYIYRLAVEIVYKLPPPPPNMLGHHHDHCTNCSK